MALEWPARIFVTGTDTGVGKSYVAALLSVGLAAAYWKPVQSGTERDAVWIRETTGLPSERLLPETYCLRDPLSPHEAARREGVRIEMDRLVLPVQERLVVEGAGGVMVPLNDEHLMIDLIADFALPVLVVGHDQSHFVDPGSIASARLPGFGCGC